MGYGVPCRRPRIWIISVLSPFASATERLAARATAEKVARAIRVPVLALDCFLLQRGEIEFDRQLLEFAERKGFAPYNVQVAKEAHKKYNAVHKKMWSARLAEDAESAAVMAANVGHVPSAPGHRLHSKTAHLSGPKARADVAATVAKAVQIPPLSRGLLRTYRDWEMRPREIQVIQYDLRWHTSDFKVGTRVFLDVSQGMDRYPRAVDTSVCLVPQGSVIISELIRASKAAHVANGDALMDCSLYVRPMVPVEKMALQGLNYKALPAAWRKFSQRKLGDLMGNAFAMAHFFVSFLVTGCCFVLPKSLDDLDRLREKARSLAKQLRKRQSRPKKKTSSASTQRPNRNAAKSSASSRVSATFSQILPWGSSKSEQHRSSFSSAVSASFGSVRLCGARAIVADVD